MKKITIIFIAAIITTFVACERLDLKPEGVLLENEAIRTQQDLAMLLNSCYDAAANQFNGRVQTYSELMGDNLTQPQSGFTVPIYLHTTNFFNSDVSDIYLRLYEIVFRTNYLMKRINDGSIKVQSDSATIMQAEAKFLRALMHFTAVRFWAQPYGYTKDNSHLGIVIRTDVSIDPKPRATVAEVYQFILQDLNDAIQNLPEKNGNYATKNAAKALLARVYFQMNRFQDALNICNDLISAYPLYGDWNHIFWGTTNSECIFGFKTTSIKDNRMKFYQDNFKITGSSPTPLKLSYSFYTEGTSDTADQRSSRYVVWNKGQTGEAYGIKDFNTDVISNPYFLSSYFWLMRAECLAELNTNLPRAIEDLNAIISRAHGFSTNYNLPSNTSAKDIIAEARKQRRLEFPLDGERVHDLKRIGVKEDPDGTGKIKIRGSVWNCPGLVLQFPNNEKTSVFIFNPEGNCN